MQNKNKTETTKKNKKADKLNGMSFRPHRGLWLNKRIDYEMNDNNWTGVSFFTPLREAGLTKVPSSEGTDRCRRREKSFGEKTGRGIIWKTFFFFFMRDG